MNKFERMIERFQLLIEIEYDSKLVARAVRLAARQGIIKWQKPLGDNK